MPVNPRADDDTDEVRTIDALRRGDAAAFRALVSSLHAPLVRMARLYVPPGLAEEVVQETWIAVIGAIDDFEGRSSVRSWVYRIMLNKVRTLARREARVVPFATATSPRRDEGPSLDPDRLGHPDLGPTYWPAAPEGWGRPDDAALQAELSKVVGVAIDSLPAAQREVVSLRDVEGWSSDEVCDALGITAANQRVLLHRGRVRLRSSIEEYLDGR